MSVCIVTLVAIPATANLIGGAIAAAATVAAASLGMKQEQKSQTKAKAGNSVDIFLNNASEVTGNVVHGQSLIFHGQDVTAEFYLDEQGKTAVRVYGNKSKAELEAIGEALAKKMVQQYAYHRLVTEMKARNMNVVEEDVEADGTIRLQVRVFQG